MGLKDRLQQVDTTIERISNTLSTNLSDKGVTPDPSGSLEVFAGQVADIEQGDTNAIFIKSDVWEEDINIPIDLTSYPYSYFAAGGKLYIKRGGNAYLRSFDIATREWTTYTFPQPISGAGTTAPITGILGYWIELNDGTVLAADTAGIAPQSTAWSTTTLPGLIGVSYMGDFRNVLPALSGAPTTLRGPVRSFNFVERYNPVTGNTTVYFNHQYRTRANTSTPATSYVQNYTIQYLSSTNNYLSAAQTGISGLSSSSANSVVNRWYVSKHQPGPIPIVYGLTPSGFIRDNVPSSGFTFIPGAPTNPSSIFESSDGKVFVTSSVTSSSTSPGIARLISTIVTDEGGEETEEWSFVESYPPGEIGQTWTIFETKHKQIYAIGGEGVLKLNEDGVTFSLAYPSGTWDKFFESAGGRLYIQPFDPLFSKFLTLNNDMTELLLIDNPLSDGSLHFIDGEDGRTYVSEINSSSSYKGLFYVDRNELNDTVSFGLAVGGVDGFTGTINGCLISSILNTVNFPIYDTRTSSITTFRNNGIVVGDWIINNRQFTKLAGSFPMEAFIPTLNLGASPILIGDKIGNVFILTAPRLTGWGDAPVLTFNVKPLHDE